MRATMRSEASVKDVRHFRAQLAASQRWHERQGFLFFSPGAQVFAESCASRSKGMKAARTCRRIVFSGPLSPWYDAECRREAT